jgi:hypothetical protein
MHSSGGVAMRGVMSLLGLVVVLGAGLFIYKSYFTADQAAMTMGTNNPRAVADVTGVKNDLIVMGQAEKQYHALNGKYVPLDQLVSEGSLNMDPKRGRQGYAYSSSVSDSSFKITANYNGPATGMPSLSIDETMQISQ